ncbi:MAG TPA: sulfatase-like hydrolase/transferase [Gemmataceae bacterium]|nr:sulfatase-like hydrolase/transferase [Gemmataceae bacterium]
MRSYLFALAAAVGVISVAAAAEPRAPNILIIVSDDQGYGDIGVHGCKDIPTPNIDSIAKYGVRCTNGYVSGPYCSPTRAGLMTGRYQTRFGHEFNPGPKDETPDIGLPLTEVTLAERFKAAGYKTGMVGKWHLGYTEKLRPTSRGFEEFYGFLAGAHPYTPPGKAGHRGIFRGTKEVEETGYLTDVFAREALAYLDRHGKEPFFLYLAFNAVHGPMHPCERYLKRFESIKNETRRTYATMLTAMDDAIGQVLQKLKDLGIADDTLITFISDNGGPEQVNASDNGPLNGGKATTWEGGIRVPFLIQWPNGKLPAGTTYDQPVIQLDLFPTVLSAARADPEGKSVKLDGVNLLPYLRGEVRTPPHEALYWRFGGQLAVRAGDWKLVKAATGGGRAGGGGAALRREKATVDGAKLFNLRDDVGEQTDLAAKMPEKVAELAGMWQKWNAELIEPRWGPPARKKGE